MAKNKEVILATARITRADLQENPGHDEIGTHVSDYLGSAAGNFQLSRAVQRTAKLGNEIRNAAGAGYSPTLTHIDAVAFGGWTFAGLWRFPRMVVDSWKSILKARTEGRTPGETTRKVEIAAKNVTETAALGSNLVGLLGRTRAFVNFANTTDFLADSIDLKIAATDVHRFGKIAQAAKDEKLDDAVQMNAKHSHTHAWIRVAKAVCSVVTGLFALALFLFGGPIVPAVILVAVALASTIFAITGHFYEKTRPYKNIDSFDQRFVNLMTTPALAASRT